MATNKIRTLAMVLLAGHVLTGCSSAKLAKSAVDQTFTSTKSADVVAACIAQSYNGDTSYMQQGEGHYVVTRNSMYGPGVRFDVIAAEGGSRVELRKGFYAFSGSDKLVACL